MYELFPRLGERRTQAAGTMSGGERQMVAMARALMPDAAGAAARRAVGRTRAGVRRRDLREDRRRSIATGVTVVMVEQNARRALAMSDRGYVLDLGKDRFEGPGRGAARRPKVAELYLGGTGRIDRADAPE